MDEINSDWFHLTLQVDLSGFAWGSNPVANAPSRPRPLQCGGSNGHVHGWNVGGTSLDDGDQLTRVSSRFFVFFFFFSAHVFGYQQDGEMETLCSAWMSSVESYPSLHGGCEGAPFVFMDQYIYIYIYNEYDMCVWMHARLVWTLLVLNLHPFLTDFSS